MLRSALVKPKHWILLPLQKCFRALEVSHKAWWIEEIVHQEGMIPKIKLLGLLLNVSLLNVAKIKWVMLDFGTSVSRVSFVFYGFCEGLHCKEDLCLEQASIEVKGILCLWYVDSLSFSFCPCRLYDPTYILAEKLKKLLVTWIMQMTIYFGEKWFLAASTLNW